MIGKLFNKPKVGLALGGGAARGISHIGVIQVLESNRVEVQAIAGTSMGAMIGSVYLIEGNSKRLIERMYEFFESDAFKEASFDVLAEKREEEEPGWLDSMTGAIRRGLKYSLSVTRQSIIGRDVFENIIKELVPDIRIEDLPKPFCAVSLDAVSGEEVIWNRGSLRDALWATSAIPGFFPPLERGEMVHVDGAWTNAVPVGPARELGANRIIAVDISREVEQLVEYKRGISLILRSAILTSKHLRELQLQDAELVIRPDVGDIHWADFSDPEDLIQKGKDAALVSLERIRQLGKVRFLRDHKAKADRFLMTSARQSSKIGKTIDPKKNAATPVLDSESGSE